MASYLIDLGNSNDGPIGMVLRVNAATRADAVEIAQRALKLVAGDLGEVILRPALPLLQHGDAVPLLREPKRRHAPAEARADHRVVVVESAVVHQASLSPPLDRPLA